MCFGLFAGKGQRLYPLPLCIYIERELNSFNFNSNDIYPDWVMGYDSNVYDYGGFVTRTARELLPDIDFDF